MANSISKKYEDKSWGELKDILKHCARLDAADEAMLEDTHTFTSRYLHTDERMPQKVPNSALIHPHYIALKGLLDKYKPVLGIA